jgi:hypothetical protein
MYPDSGPFIEVLVVTRQFILAVPKDQDTLARDALSKGRTRRPYYLRDGTSENFVLGHFVLGHFVLGHTVQGRIADISYQIFLELQIS